MNIYALIPLAAAVGYVFLLLTVLGSRPWKQQHRLFIWMLIPAVIWSLADFLLRLPYYLIPGPVVYFLPRFAGHMMCIKRNGD